MNITLKQRLVSLQSHLMNFAVSLTGNRDEASDLLQDTTLKVLDNEEKYTDNVNFQGWVFTIMRNLFINNYRKQVRHNTVVDTSEDLFKLNTSQESGLSNPEGSVAVHEIMDSLNSLSDDYRVPFTLYVQGYKYNEIADKMGLPLGTIKSRIFFARRMLRDELSAYRD
ncbi:MAG: RNA polymerase sigma factor [Muribaculaceae bacterium]|nr:RNA polymerase sigma factor [Bacteroidales bacterium]MDE6243264.1 RNA polymerase sigma factor [Muribaculaceae bacterium]